MSAEQQDLKRSRCACLCGMALVIMLIVSACATHPPAPVEHRDRPRPAAPPPAQQAPAVYEVRRGDTLYSIAFRFGMDWRELARWNRIGEPYLIRPGQELRMTAPPATVAARPAPAPTPAPQAPPRSEQPATEPAPESTRPAQAETRAPLPAPSPAAERSVAGINWRWPTAGNVTRRFDPSATRRGISIGGDEGQPVVAAADGEVVYSGTALIGYGELIIIKHSASMLSAYAHNSRRLVEEGQRVRAGQQIAELGINDRQEPALHFEIRRDGQPRDPLQFLPQR